ncbi:amidohydrolase family protein [Kamptonema cortianum]|nr:amidohydrolase family protein [Geitlerinema splendidum]MDK3157719.1 amidohydrolase family protein [Kamptonema cortianum]
MKFIANTWHEGVWGPCEVSIETGAVEISPSAEQSNLYLVPGFVDIHIHGAFGIDFMTASSAEMLTLADKLEEEGYEAFLPTTVTAPFLSVNRAFQVIPDHPAILGVHLEGPFISQKHPGAQPPADIADIPDGKSDWDEVFQHPLLRLITLAPECKNGLALVRRLAHRGVVVSAGHTDATYDQMVAAVENGLTHATHTYNAMRPFHHREAGTVGAVLSLPEINAELIYDRLHVSRAAADLLLKAKGPNCVIAVSDCTAAKGLAENSSIKMWGHDCVVANGSVRIADSGALAGSAASLLDVFRNLVEDFGWEVAGQLCCLNPRRILKMRGIARKWLLFSSDLDLRDQFNVSLL